MSITGNSVILSITQEGFEISIYFQYNAGAHLLPEAGVTQERTL